MKPKRARGLFPVALLCLTSAVAPHNAQGSAEDDFRKGETAFQAGDTAAAETHFRSAWQSDPGHLRALLRLATVVSWDDGRLPEARGLYLKAIEIDPGNVDGKLGVARVCSWQGDFDCALGGYASLRAENPSLREASLGLARSQGWAGKLRESRETYLEILSDDPGDVEARNGLAAVLSWDGRLDEALALYEETLREHPSDRDALAGRARVLHWQGRALDARSALDEALAKNPGDREASKLDRTMKDAMAPVITASTGVVHDNDNNAFNLQRLSYTRGFDAGRAGGLSYDRYEAALPPSSLAARLETFRAFGNTQAGRAFGFNASAGIERITHARSENTTHLAGSAGADWRFTDELSFSGSLSRETLASTAKSLDIGVRMTSGSAGAVWQALPRLTARAVVERANFTDGNQRDLRSASVRWAVPLRRPKMGISVTERYMSYDRSAFGDSDLAYRRVSSGAYFAPRRYLAETFGVDLSDRIGRRIGWSLLVTRGRQRVYDLVTSGPLPGFNGHTDLVTGYHASLSRDFGRGLTLEAYAGLTDLAISTGSGFRSTESGLRLRYRMPGTAAGAAHR